MNNLINFILQKLVEIHLRKCKTEEEIPAAMYEMADLFEKYARILRILAKAKQKS